MDVSKLYKFIGIGAIDATKPYKFIGFAAMDVTKPYKFVGDIDGSKPYKFRGPGRAMRVGRAALAPQACQWADGRGKKPR